MSKKKKKKQNNYLFTIVSMSLTKGYVGELLLGHVNGQR